MIVAIPGYSLHLCCRFCTSGDLCRFCCCTVNCKTELTEVVRLSNECATKGQKTWPWHESWNIGSLWSRVCFSAYTPKSFVSRPSPHPCHKPHYPQWPPPLPPSPPIPPGPLTPPPTLVLTSAQSLDPSRRKSCSTLSRPLRSTTQGKTSGCSCTTRSIMLLRSWTR